MVGGDSLTSVRSDVGVGGLIEVLGDKVAVYDNARVDASGASGGGTVLVGGDYQGKNADVQNATATYIGANAQISADATDSGNGGKVIIWADDITRYFGEISARGGAQSGDGGFVEVSGKGTLLFQGRVDTLAPKGQAGTLLLDPTEITISVTGTDDLGAGPTFGTGAGGVQWGTLDTALATNATVTVQTATDSIEIADEAFTFTLAAGATTLVLTSAADIIAAGTGTIISAGATDIALELIAVGAVDMGTNFANFANFSDAKFDVGAASAYAGVVSGTGTTLTKAGSGTFTLSGTNTYAGLTTISLGTLSVFGATAAAGTGTIVVGSNTLDIANAAVVSNAVTINGGTISNSAGAGTLQTGGVTLLGTSTLSSVGTGLTVSAVIGDGGGSFFGVNKVGAGTVTLTGANTYTGDTNISEGTLSVFGATAAAGTGTIAVRGNTLDIASAAVVSNAVTIIAGTISNSAGVGTLQTGGLILLATSTLSSVGTGLTVSADISDAGGTGLDKAGAGTVTLTGSNTYAGATTIAAGVLNANSTAALGDGSATNTLIFTGGTLQAGGTITSLAARGVTLTSTGIIDTNGNAVSLAGVATGAGGLTKQGLGTLILSGVNAFTGATTIAAGVLNADSTNALGDGSATNTLIFTGGTLQAGGTITSPSTRGVTLTSTGIIDTDGNAVTLGGIATGAGGLTKQGLGTLILSGVNAFTGATTITTGTLALDGTGTIAASSGVANAGALTIGANKTIDSMTGAGTTGLGAFTLTIGDASNTSSTYTGIASGTGGITKAGTGTLTLTGANTYTGTTTVNAGTLLLNGGTLAAASSLVVNGGSIFDVGTANQTFAAVQLVAGTIQNGTLTLNTGNYDLQSGTVSAQLAGTAGAAKSTAGAVTLSGTAANTFTGLTTVSAGTLSLSKTAGQDAIAGGGLTVSGGTAVLTATNQINDAANVVVSGGTLNIGANSDTVGGVQLTAGSIIGAGGILTSTTTFDLQAGTVTANLGGAVAVKKIGAGTLNLNSANSYTGATAITGGIVSVTNNLSLGTPGTGTTLTNATLNTNGLTIGAGAFAEPITFNNGTLIGTGSLGTNAGSLLIVPGGSTATLAGAFNLADNFSVGTGAGSTLNISAPITANGFSFAVSGGLTNLTTDIGSARSISFAALNVATNVVLKTDNFNLSGPVTGTGDLTIQRVTASAADTNLGGATDPLFSDVAQFTTGFTGTLNIGGTRDTPPTAAQTLNNIIVSAPLTTGGDVFILGAGDVSFVGAGKVTAAGQKVTIIAAGSDDSVGNITDDNPSLVAPSFITAATLELAAANLIGSEANVLNVTANTVSFSQGQDVDAQVRNTNFSAANSDSILSVLNNLSTANFGKLGPAVLSNAAVQSVATPQIQGDESGFVDEGVFLLPDTYTSPERAVFLSALEDSEFPGTSRPDGPNNEAEWQAFFDGDVREFIASRYPLSENASDAEKAAVEALITAELQTVIEYYESVRARERTQLAADKSSSEPAPGTESAPPEAPGQQGAIQGQAMTLGYVGQAWSEGGIGFEVRG